MRPTPALIPRLITYVPHAPHPPAYAYAAAHAADGPMGRPYSHANAYGSPAVGNVSPQHVKAHEKGERNEDGGVGAQGRKPSGMQMQQAMVRSSTLHPSLVRSHGIRPFTSGGPCGSSLISPLYDRARSGMPLPGLVVPLRQDLSC